MSEHSNTTEVNYQPQTEIPSESPNTKTTVAQAVEQTVSSPKYFSELEFSRSQQSELKQDYKQLDSFIEDEPQTLENTSFNSEIQSEPAPEPMSEKDILFTASMGVNAGVGIIESLVKAPVKVDDQTKANIIEKAAPVIKKHMGDGQMPAWLTKYQEEFSLAIAIGGACFELYRQAKMHKAAERAAEKALKESFDEKLQDDVVAADAA